MNKNIPDVGIKPIKVKSQPHEKKSSSASKRLSKLGSMSTNPANEVYYGDSPVSVPFRWESRPGTPKISFGESLPLPPLTPPPSYLSSPARKPVKKHHSEAGNNYNNSSGILHSVLPKINFIRKSHLQSPSLSSSSSSSSSVSSYPWSSSRSVRSSPCTPQSGDVPRRRLSFSRRKGADDEDDEDGEYEEEHLANLCFGIAGHSNSSKRGCSANFIKLLLGQHA